MATISETQMTQCIKALAAHVFTMEVAKHSMSGEAAFTTSRDLARQNLDQIARYVSDMEYHMRDVIRHAQERSVDR